MKLISQTFDAAMLEFDAPELGVLSDLLGQALGYQESSSAPIDYETRAHLEVLYSGLTGTLDLVWQEDEQRSGPFLPGQQVVRIFDDSGEFLQEKVHAVVVTQHQEDPNHDYSWTTIRLADGREEEAPTYQLRRADASAT
jgi:hypothetical protein